MYLDLSRYFISRRGLRCGEETVWRLGPVPVDTWRNSSSCTSCANEQSRIYRFIVFLCGFCTAIKINKQATCTLTLVFLNLFPKQASEVNAPRLVQTVDEWFQKDYHDNVSEHCPEENMTRFETNSEKKIWKWPQRLMMRVHLHIQHSITLYNC